MDNLKVGERYPQFQRADGVYLGYGLTGLRLIYIMVSPTQEEIRDVKAGSKLNLRMGVLGEHIVMCVKAGNQPWSDCTFAPWCHPDMSYDVDIEEDEGLAMVIELYDGKNGELKSVRLATLPHNFSIQFLKYCRELLRHKTDLSGVTRSINAIMRRSTRELIDLCDVRASIGGDA